MISMRKFLAVLLGLLLGAAVNMAIVIISPTFIPLPEGVDPADIESLKNSIDLFEPKHFIFPFLAHSIGTLVGAFLAAFIVKENKIHYAMAIGVFFLVGGITNIFMIPSPVWFIILDLALAYLPTAFLAGKFAQKFSK